MPEATLMPFVVGFLLGAVLGTMGYRFMLKRNPELLEKWAKEIKEASGKIGS